MGDVYKARHLNLDIPVAVKILDPQLASSPEIVERFILEARATARLDSPYVVRVFQVGEEKGFYFLQMELIEGESLADKIKKEGPLEAGMALLFLQQIALGLTAAHNANIIHRDIKPANILLSNKGFVKLTDFGLAKCMEISSAITHSGQILGTPYYLAPEQCEGKGSDIRSDIYALGVTFYFMLTGKCPFQGENFVAVALAKLHSDPPSPRQHRAAISREIELLTLKMIARIPDARYQNTGELLHDIQSLFPGYGIPLPAQSLNPNITPAPIMYTVPVKTTESVGKEHESLLVPTATDLCAVAYKTPAGEKRSETVPPLHLPKKDDSSISKLATPPVTPDASGEEEWEEWEPLMASNTVAPSLPSTPAPAAEREEDVMFDGESTRKPRQQDSDVAALEKADTVKLAAAKTPETEAVAKDALWSKFKGLLDKPTAFVNKVKSALQEEVGESRETMYGLLCKPYLNHAEALRREGKFTEAVDYLRNNVPAKMWCQAIDQKIEELSNQSQEIQVKLIKLMQVSRNKEAKAAILQELTNVGDAAVAPLISALRNESWGVRAAAAEVLGQLGAIACSAIPALIETLQDENESVGIAVATALGAMGGKASAAIPMLTPKLKTWNWRLRNAAAKALAQIGGDATNVLAQTLKDKVALVREASAYALGEMGEAAIPALPALIQAINDKVWEVRKAAVEALGKLGPHAQASMPALTEALQDADNRMKNAARLALKKIRNQL